MRKVAFRMGLVTITLSLILALSGLLGVPASRGDGQREDVSLSVASLRGAYGAHGVGIGGVAPVSALGVLYFDGAGNFLGRSIWNKPDGAGGRETVEVTFAGTYDVDPEGVGVMVATEGGALDEVVFVITKTERIRGRNVAVEVRGLPSDVDPLGNLSNLSMTRQL